MGTHPIFESDFDCLTESEMDDEFAKFMSEVNDTPALVAPEPAPAGPRKRGLPAAYANRTNMFSSLKPKVRKIEIVAKIKTRLEFQVKYLFCSSIRPRSRKILT